MVIDSAKIFYQDLKNSFKDLLPIVVVVTFFQIAIVRAMPENFSSIVVGLVIVAIGLALFIRGLELGIFPIGESLATDFAKKGSFFWLMLFAFTIGFSTTVAEPALIAIADKAAAISAGNIIVPTGQLLDQRLEFAPFQSRPADQRAQDRQAKQGDRM